MFQIYFLAIALATSAYGAGLPPVPVLNSRIVGGYPVNIEEVPYQVSLLLDYFGNNAFYHSCGGSIISKSAILTAAHCTNGTSALQWKIRAGTADIDFGGVFADVLSIIENPNFNSRMDNDIALVKLSSPLVLGTTIQTITLPAQGASVSDGSIGIVTGWGTTFEGGDIQSKLRKISVPTINQLLCSSAYSPVNPVTSNMICAGQIGLGGQDACQGDSGGPLAVNKMLVGITSWGYGCGEPEYPGVYTRVASYRTWIQTNIVN